MTSARDQHVHLRRRRDIRRDTSTADAAETCSRDTSNLSGYNPVSRRISQRITSASVRKWSNAITQGSRYTTRAPGNVVIAQSSHRNHAVIASSSHAVPYGFAYSRAARSNVASIVPGTAIGRIAPSRRHCDLKLIPHTRHENGHALSM